MVSLFHMYNDSIKTFLQTFSISSHAGPEKDTFMRPPSGEEEIPLPISKPAKERKRKRTSTSDEPKPKKRVALKITQNIVPLSVELANLLREEEEDEEKEDDSILVARVRTKTEGQKATRSVEGESVLPQSDRTQEGDSVGIPESVGAKCSSPRDEKVAEKAKEAGPETPRDEENAPRDPLVAIEIGDSPSLPSFSEGMIREARAMETPNAEGAHGGEDPFYGYFARVEDAAGLSDLEISKKDSGGTSSSFRLTS